MDFKSHSDVTIFSPGGFPGVSDDSIVFSVICSITNGDDSVVKVISTITVVEDSTFVSMENATLSINGNASWSRSDGGFQCGDTVFFDMRVGTNSDNFLGFLGFARFSFSNVWIILFEFHWVFRSILESSGLTTTIATMTFSIAINELRFSELEKLSSLDKVSTLHDSRGSESPAGTAVSLVLNWVNSSLLSPVDLSGFDGVDLLNLKSFGGVGNSSHHLVGLILSHGGEHVVSNNKGVLWIGVDLFVIGISLGEEGHSEGVLFLGSIVNVEVGNVFHESGFNSLGGSGSESSGESAKHFDF